MKKDKKEEISAFAKHRAAQAWCTPETERIEMDLVLAEAFAAILDEVLSESWVGNATIRELLEELSIEQINGIVKLGKAKINTEETADSEAKE